LTEGVVSRKLSQRVSLIFQTFFLFQVPVTLNEIFNAWNILMSVDPQYLVPLGRKTDSMYLKRLVFVSPATGRPLQPVEIVHAHAWNYY